MPQLVHSWAWECSAAVAAAAACWAYLESSRHYSFPENWQSSSLAEFAAGICCAGAPDSGMDFSAVIWPRGWSNWAEDPPFAAASSVAGPETAPRLAVSSAAGTAWPGWDWETPPAPIGEPFRCSCATAVAEPDAFPPVQMPRAVVD